MKLIDKAAVVAEIEKYISNYKGILNKIDKSSDEWVTSTLMLESKIDVLQHILSFLDTLEVKEVREESVSKDLEEAAFDYAEACKYDGGEKLLCVEHFKAGAQWQKQKNTIGVKEVDLEKELETLDSLLYDLDGVAVKGATSYLTVEDVKDIAKHFFELGLKAKGE